MHKLILITLVYSFFCLNTFSQEQEESIDELNRRIENPLSRYWSLIFQGNYGTFKGDALNEAVHTNVINFQPSLPVPIAKSKMLLIRPVFPWITAPVLKPDSMVDYYTSGFGDMQVFSLFGPDKKDGLIWGLGLTFVFPTASTEFLGKQRFQMGPAIMLLSISKKWTLGGIVQNWFYKPNDKVEASSMDIQYIFRRQIKGKGMSIGMGPNVVIDWQAEPGNQLTFPIGLGITKTVKWGKTPWKLRIEPQYALIKPDNIGAEWNLRIQIAPIIKNPFH